MSKVAIQGNASGTGTFTIAAPNSNTDRTLTLPDEAGTVLTSGTPLSSFPSGFANGITHITTYRLTADLDPVNNGEIIATSNIEIPDETLYSSLGTEVSYNTSTGVFTLPTTGLWMVTASATFYSTDDNFVGIAIYTSVDSGSNWDLFALGQDGGKHDAGLAGGSGNMAQGIINITNTSTQKIAIFNNSFNSDTQFLGNTAYNYTHFTFMRVGDSQ